MTLMRKISISFIFIAFSFVLSCSKKSENVTQWPYGVNYEVFVRSYADSNGDGIGDFNGLTSRLDYLKDLGVGGIWLMPIMPSPTYHKYDVVDYKAVDEEYGNQEDFQRLVEEAHKRGIRILVDLIVNHTGSDHPWFKSAIDSKDSPYRDYYVWANKDSIREQISKKTTSLDSDNITQWHPVNGDTLAEHYYGFFWGGMPDLNLDNPKVKHEFVEIGKYWLNEMKVDGFRLDAAKHIFPTDRAVDNHTFWKWFRDEMQKIKPDVYLVGEVWSKAENVAPYLKGLPALFNFDMGYAITGVVSAGKDTIDIISKYKEINDFYKSSTSEFIDATFLKNHDQNRILSELGADQNKARVAAAILFTLPGTPYVYYGEEIGMIGMKPDEYIREPFIWDYDAKDKTQTSWEVPKYSTSETVIPLYKQKENPSSLYSFYRRIIQYRNSSTVLTYGGLDNAPVNIREVVSFIREKESEKCLVLHNISDVEVTIKLVEELTEFQSIEFTTNKEASVRDGEVRLPAYASVVLK
jgi:alpha-amylase